MFLDLYHSYKNYNRKNYINDKNYVNYNYKLNKLIMDKQIKKQEYIISPSSKIIFDIILIQRQIDSIITKLKKNGNSKLRNEIK